MRHHLHTFLLTVIIAAGGYGFYTWQQHKAAPFTMAAPDLPLEEPVPFPPQEDTPPPPAPAISYPSAPVFIPPPIPEHRAVDERPIIAIIIDDVGVDYKRSLRAEKLPAEVTLAYLPYSRHLQAQTARALSAGHELMVHLPMEPERAGIDPGPDYLGTRLPVEEIARRVEKNLSAFEGYVAVNNHMGSQFTQDRARLETLMTGIRKRGVMFIDSKTAPQSLAERAARDAGIAASHRDIFIDHTEDAAHVAQSLALIEKTARKYGSVIAIGHPKDVTLDALEQWLPTLHEKGFRLVPVTEAIRYRSEKR